MGKNTKNYLSLYLGCECIADGRPAIIDSVSQHPAIDTVTARFTDTDQDDDWSVYNNLADVKPVLWPVIEETLSDDVLVELWPVIGGAPHLFEYGKDELKKVLLTGDCGTEDDEPISLQLDFFTMAQLINKLRELRFDCDDLIAQDLAVSGIKMANDAVGGEQ